MGKFVPDAVLDVFTAKIATGTILTVCSTQPTNRTEAVTTYALADVVVTPGDGNGDFTLANGDTSGRKCTVAAQNAITVDTSGNADHVAVCDASELLAVTTTSSTTALTSGGSVSTNAWDVEIADAA